MEIELENTPEFLQKFGLFCLWKYEERNGRPTKVPYNPHNLNRGDSTDKNAFVPFPTIKMVWSQYRDKFSGIGVGVFGRIGAVDIDHCIDDAGDMSELARDIVTRLQSYTERSPSGEGIRIFFEVLNTDWYDAGRYYKNNRTIGLEIYLPGTTNRFLTLTGNRIEAWPVMQRTEQIKKILDDYMVRQSSQEQPALSNALPVDLSDSELINKAAAASNGDLFRRLWSGDISGYPSHSEADQALCNILAFWTGCNATRIDSLFRRSGLMRGKWNRRQSGTTYGAITVQNAIRNCKTAYSPRGDPQKDFSGNPKPKSLKPKDYTDLGQVAVFVQEYGKKVKYSEATRFLVYDGQVWKENDLDAQRLVQVLAERQTKEARKAWHEADDKVMSIIEARAGKIINVMESESADEKRAKEELKKAQKYHSWAMKQQGSTSISKVLKELKPQVQIEVEQLDSDGLLLNTPSGTVDLRTGKIFPHRCDNYCTKITGTAPSGKNAELYHGFIDQVTNGNKELARYLQEVAGMCAVGKVYSEKLIIAYGEGGNGKSTLFNLWADVLGDYAGTIPSESLVVRAGNAKDYSIANLRGKRLIIAAELREGARLSTDAVKKMCSTDKVTAEKKFKDSFEFKPSHTIVLYTNILPKVGTNDSGTWSRLVVVPFGAKFRDQAGEIKNYSDYLFRKCGGAVLEWIIEGARRFIANGGSMKLPGCVQTEINQYRDQNDWFGEFLEECCITGNGLNVGSGDLYKAYGQYCEETGEYRRSKPDFNTALAQAGYARIRDKKGVRYYGLTLRYREYKNQYRAQ